MEAHIGIVAEILGSDFESEDTTEPDTPDWLGLVVFGCRWVVGEHRRDWVARRCWGTGWD